MKICKCGEPLSAEAWIKWNPDSQKWEFDELIQDTLYCLKCGAEYSTAEHPAEDHK